MKTDSFPKSKLEKAFNILNRLSWCVGVSALLVGIENFSFYHNKVMGNVFMAVSLFAIILAVLISSIKIALGSYLIQLSFKENCKHGLHFGQSSKAESNRYAYDHGQCFYCKEIFFVKKYKIEFNESEFFFETHNAVQAIRKLQEQQNKSKSLGSIFIVTDLSSVGTRISTYIVKENGLLDIKK